MGKCNEIIRAATSTGIGIGIAAFFGGIAIGKHVIQVPILLLIPYMCFYNEFLKIF